MKEKNLNTIINNEFKKIGFSHKIADPLGGTGIQNPFDGFSVFDENIIFWESKLLKGYQAFNFKKIEEHQFKNLSEIKKQSYADCIIIVGVWEAYKYLHLYFFDIELIAYLKSIEKKSILKKEFLQIKSKNQYLDVIKKTIPNLENCKSYFINKLNYDKLLRDN